jgi:hypothetical protein
VSRALFGLLFPPALDRLRELFVFLGHLREAVLPQTVRVEPGGPLFVKALVALASEWRRANRIMIYGPKSDGAALEPRQWLPM